MREIIEDKEYSNLKGKQLFPHEIVQKFTNNSYYGRNTQMSSMEKDNLSCQWNDIRKNVIEAMAKAKKVALSTEDNEESSAGPTIDLGKVVSLVDVSGSIYGTPMEVAIALGLLVSEIASPAYGHRCLTFSAEPKRWQRCKDHRGVRTQTLKWRWKKYYK